MRDEIPSRTDEASTPEIEQNAFLTRAMLARKHASESGKYVAADKVIERLEQMLRQARERPHDGTDPPRK